MRSLVYSPPAIILVHSVVSAVEHNEKSCIKSCAASSVQPPRLANPAPSSSPDPFGQEEKATPRLEFPVSGRARIHGAVDDDGTERNYDVIGSVAPSA